MRTDRLKHVATVRVSNVDKKCDESDPRVLLCNYTDVYYNERITGDLNFMVATATRDQCATFGLHSGDVVLTKDSETADDIGVSALIAEDVQNLVCGYHLAIVRPLEFAYGPYLRWVLASDAARQAMSSAATGVTRFGLRSDAISDLEIPMRPLEEQRAIAHYLDRETARIDALIFATERVDDLTAERLRVQISLATRASRAVSQTEQMPAGWEMVALRRCLSTMNYGIGSATSSDGKFPVLGMSNVQAGEVTEDAGGYVDAVDSALLLSPGDLLFNRTNSRELVGKIGLVRRLDRPTTFASYLVRLRANGTVSAPYLNYLLNTEEVLGLARSMALPSIGQANLNPSRYSTIRIPVPPAAEQAAIVRMLEQARRDVSSLSRAVQRRSALLRVRRQALITAAVTGQIDMPVAA